MLIASIAFHPPDPFYQNGNENYGESYNLLNSAKKFFLHPGLFLTANPKELVNRVY